jgi:hypothetical protein
VQAYLLVSLAINYRTRLSANQVHNTWKSWTVKLQTKIQKCILGRKYEVLAWLTNQTLQEYIIIIMWWLTFAAS